MLIFTAEVLLPLEKSIPILFRETPYRIISSILPGKFRIFFALLFLWPALATHSQVRRIVVIGSSTARGTGASVPDSGWVRLLSREYKCRMELVDTVFNLASSGTTFYHGMPDDCTPPPFRPSPLSANNVSRAVRLLSSLPNRSQGLVIVNYPSGGYDTYSVEEIMTGLQTIYDTVMLAGNRCLISTTQPRSDAAFNTPAIRKKLADLKDSILLRFGPEHAVDFYEGLFNPADSSIRSDYAAGDNVHFNDAGHRVLCERVIAKNPFGLPVWYSKSTGMLNDLSTWGCNPDGSGSYPDSFSADHQTFIITNNPAPTISGNWTLDGKNTRVFLGNGTEQIDLLIPADYQLTIRRTGGGGCP